MKGLLKFITCGSVDDGKSTLIGRMLYDAKLLFTDQEKALELDSKVGSRDGKIDYSLLLDGLMAEREQGITIDVAYRYFTTEVRSFIVADTPGHEEYTRNMAVGASFADLAVILLDATQGVLVQTKRHARICSLMGIRYFVFAVNKMDLIRYDRYKFEVIKAQIHLLCTELGLTQMVVIPLSASEGDNITKRSDLMPWYEGEVLLPYLEDVNIEEDKDISGLILPVQRVCRPNHSFRGFQGEIQEGSVACDDEITILPSGEKARVAKILLMDQPVKKANKGQPVTLQLDREVDVSRGCVLSKGYELKDTNLFNATVLWMDDDTLIAGKNYLAKIGTKLVPATVIRIKYKIDINSGDHVASETIRKNEIASCDVALSERTALDKFKDHKSLGQFILIDRVSNMTSACGIVEHSLRRTDNVIWQELDITRGMRAGQKNQNPLTIWFTGLSGSGKSTLANELDKRLVARGKHTMILDGDNIRHGLNSNLGFKEQDRIENIRRVAEVAKLMNDAGLIVLSVFISPYERDRESAKAIIGDDFVQIYVSTPLVECEKRDVKGLYRKARAGEIPNFTGITEPYEKPQNPDITVDTEGISIDEAVDYIVDQLAKWL